MAHELNIGFENMLEVYDRGIIGTKEFREWLSVVSPVFAGVRDGDIDDDIIARAEYNRRALAEQAAYVAEEEAPES